MTRENSLEIKGIAIIFLVFHHLFRTPEMVNKYDVTLSLLNVEQITFGAAIARVCVWMFAFITAYGISVQYGKLNSENRFRGGTTIKFIGNRIVKLLLPFQFVLLLLWTVSFVLFPEKILFCFMTITYGIC